MSVLGSMLLKSIRLVSFRPAVETRIRYAGTGQAQQHRPTAERLKSILEQTFPAASVIEVNDISGGCGAMFEISVEASQLKGLSIVKQHRLVTEALKEEIKDMHGLRIHTSVPT